MVCPTVMSLAEVIRQTDDQMVVSVGPYIFHNSPFESRASANGGRIGSPPQSILKPDLPFQSDSSSMRHWPGVAWRIVAPDDSITRESFFGSRHSSLVAMWTRAPEMIGRSSSISAISNDRVVTARKTSLSLMPGSERMDHR